MAEAKTKPTAVTFDEFLAKAVDPGRHADRRVIATMMQAATGEMPVMWGNIIGFGRYGYQYTSVALASGRLPHLLHGKRI